MSRKLCVSTWGTILLLSGVARQHAGNRDRVGAADLRLPRQPTAPARWRGLFATVQGARRWSSCPVASL